VNTVLKSDIAAMLARKNQLRASAQTPASMKMEKARLTQARTLAIRRQDGVELAELDAKLAELATHSISQGSSDFDSIDDMLAKVNERNRKANVEAVRMAELREAERKRKERKLAVQGGGGANTPRPVIQDPSARLKTVPRVSYTASPRPGTPSTPVIGPTQPENTRQVSPLPDKPKAISLEASIDSIEVNLGDF
jgi:RNA polymerase-associated protein RTF1